MHAVSRLTLHPYIQNIQVSWVKLGPKGAESCLNAGVNDMGGTLMNESISKAAGSIHGQEFSPVKMEEFIKKTQRSPALRDTLYNELLNSDYETIDGMELFMNSAHPAY
jgi:FO synthase